jgi:tRNA C32,U32 (ribose-2'-O)-methylase TrmJ
LFGQENNGLTNKEISHANYILSIPTKSNSSLNLSHTVALIAYELSQMSFSKISSSKIVTPASAKDIEKFLSFLMKILEKRKFTSISSKRDNLEISLRNFLKTSKIDQKQIKTVYGVLKFITK